MRRLLPASVALFFVFLSALSSARADGLRVSPVTLEVMEPGATSVVTLKNQSRAPITVQVRVFEWTQKAGHEQLSPTRKVVVSPPMVRLPPRATQVIRVIRTEKGRVSGEEAYRVFIDELPDFSRNSARGVQFVTRLRLPLFFVATGSPSAKVEWNIVRKPEGAFLIGRNTSETHLRVADLNLERGGKMVFSRVGLAGYVLGKSTMSFRIPSRVHGPLNLRAETNYGRYHAPVRAR